MILDIGRAPSSKGVSILVRVITLVCELPVRGIRDGAVRATALSRSAEAAAELVRRRQLSRWAGGGDTVAALNGGRNRQPDDLYIGAGGAFPSLEWLEGKPCALGWSCARQSRIVKTTWGK